MTKSKKSPKTTRKSRQNPWYKNQVSSLDGRHTRLSDKVRALKAFANSTEVSLQETQQELAFAREAIRKLALLVAEQSVDIRNLQTITIGAGKPLKSSKPDKRL